MKGVAVVAVIALLIIVFAVIRILTSRGSRPPVSDEVHQNRDVHQTFEEKLAVLERCGLKLSPASTKDDLLKIMDRSDYEEAGWDAVLIGLGSEEEEEPHRSMSDNIWYFDTECIEDHGDYKRIAERMAQLSQGSLPLTEIKDYVDIEDNKAWLSFKLNDKEIKIDCKVEDDWVDTEIFSKFVELLEKTDPSKIYIYYDLGGQDCIIGCVSRSQLSQLQHDGIEFVPLS